MSEVEVLLVLISDKNANSIKSVNCQPVTRIKANTLRTGLHKKGTYWYSISNGTALLLRWCILPLSSS